jgi:predicted esterase
VVARAMGILGRMRRLVLFAAMALTACGGATPAAHAAKADLVVSAGSVKQVGNRVTGTVSFRNAGSKRAPKSLATLLARTPGNPHLVAEITVRAMNPGAERLAEVSAAVPKGIPSGSFALRVCADVRNKVAERAERNNCRQVGSLGPSAPGGDSRPGAPISYKADKPFQLNSPQSPYWIHVPSSYDSTHATPTTLFVWMHGCGGDSGGDIFTIAPEGGRSYIAVSLGGRDGDCWNVEQDQIKVLAAISDVKTHFNIDPRQVILGGYSSGGDLAYRTAFYNSNQFAGVLAENTAPFRDTGSTQAKSLAAANSKFHVVHLAHTGDDTYPIGAVRKEVQALKDNGFPAELVERPGSHYDADEGNTGTDHDLRTILLPHLADGWLAR